MSSWKKAAAWLEKRKMNPSAARAVFKKVSAQKGCPPRASADMSLSGGFRISSIATEIK